MTIPRDYTPPDYPGKWEKSAERENARRRRDAPLLFWGGLVPLATAAEREKDQKESWAYLQRNLDLHDARCELKAELYRRRVAFVVSTAELEQLDEKRKVYPPDGAYSATIWMKWLEERGGRRLERAA